MRSSTLRSLVFSLPFFAFSVSVLASYQVTTEIGDAVAAEVVPGDPQNTAEFLVKAIITGNTPAAVVVALRVNADAATATYTGGSTGDFTLTFPSSSAPSSSTCAEETGTGETITYVVASTGGNTFDLTLGGFNAVDTGSAFGSAITKTFICTVTIAAVDDASVEGTENLNLTIDPTADPVAVAAGGAVLKQEFTISDNDTVGLFVTDVEWPNTTPPGTGTLTQRVTSENGDLQPSFWVELASRPVGLVRVDVAVDTPTEALIIRAVDVPGSDASSLFLDFNPGNWNTGQQVIITGQDDAPANPQDPNTPYVVTVTTGGSQGDSAYDNLVGGPVQGINQDNDVPGQLRFTALTLSGVSGDEGNTVTLQVERVDGSSGPVTVDYAISPGSALVSDYSDTTAPSGTLSWADATPGIQNISIALADDTLWEPAIEDFTVTLSNPTGGAVLLAPASQTVNINPSDPITITIAPQLNPNEVTEGNTGDPQVPVLFDVTYAPSGALASPLPITWGTTDGSATGGVDYDAVVAAPINLPTSSTPVTIAVNVNGDNTPEGNETFFAQLSESLNLVTLAGGGSSMATILNDDIAADGIFSITDISPNPVDETPTPSTVTVTVSRTGASGSPISDATIRLHTVDTGSATDGADYVGQDVILTWDAGSGLTSDRTVDIVINEDASGESDETFDVIIEDDPGAAPTTQTFGVATGVVTILGDPVVAFNPNSYSVNETAGTVTVWVERTNDDSAVVTVDYTTANGTAIAGQDYTPPGGTMLTWNPGDLAPKPITIPIIADADTAGPETFTVDLSNCVNCTINGSTQTTVTITETAVPPTSAGSLAFSPASTTVSEGVGSAGLFVTRTGGTDGAASVNWETQPGTATAPGDFTASAGTLNWNDGEGGSKALSVPITDDAVQEPSQSFTVRLVVPPPPAAAEIASASGTQAISKSGTQAATVSSTPATVTITDNDTPVPGEFSILNANVSEGGGTINVTVTRNVGSTGAVAVTYTTVSGVATGANPADAATDDYLYTTGTLNWADGDSAAKMIAITIVDDGAVEPAETFAVDLSSPTGGASIADGSATVTIFDNDGGGTFSISDVTVGEQDLQATVTVTRANDNDTAAFVFWQTFDGTAQDETGSNDYQSGSGELQWLAGDTSSTRTITIPIVVDGLDEGSEFFTVTLVAVKGSSVSITKADGIVTINDPIPIPTLSQWAMGLLVLLLLGLGAGAMRGQRRVVIRRS